MSLRSDEASQKRNHWMPQRTGEHHLPHHRFRRWTENKQHESDSHQRLSSHERRPSSEEGKQQTERKGDGRPECEECDEILEKNTVTPKRTVALSESTKLSNNILLPESSETATVPTEPSSSVDTSYMTPPIKSTVPDNKSVQPPKSFEIPLPAAVSTDASPEHHGLKESNPRHGEGRNTTTQESLASHSDGPISDSNKGNTTPVENETSEMLSVQSPPAQQQSKQQKRQSGSPRQRLKAIESTLLTDVQPDMFMDTAEAVKMRRRKSAEHKQQQQQQPPAADRDNVINKPSLTVKKRKNSTRTSSDMKRGSTDEVDVGTRVKVFWELENKLFAGTVAKYAPSKKKPYFVEYDDGDREWVDLAKEEFQILKKQNDKKAETENAKVAAVKVGRIVKQRKPTATGPTKKRSSSGPNKSHKIPDKKKRDDKTKGAAVIAGAKKRDSRKAKRESGKASEPIDWVSAGIMQRGEDDSSTDEDELNEWAAKMLGAPKPIARRRTDIGDSYSWAVSGPLSISEKVKVSRRRSSGISYSQTKKRKLSAKQIQILFENEKAADSKRRKEEARTLTTAEVRAVLEEDCPHKDCSSWVRRSVRQPSKSTLNAPQVKALLDKLPINDSDMVVLKMKKYCSDPATPPLVIDAVLDALEENTNCEALYIQNFNEGMQDDQVMHLLRVLQLPSCKIWCLNIGETYKVKTSTWEKFAKGLKDTKITHMYASEHTITTELKDEIRATIRSNRSKHTMHNDPKNLDTIIQCTHCWWNPWNTKVLRPYIKRYEDLLRDTEKLGLKGSVSGAHLS